MSLAPGRRLGPYEVLGAIGAGGMGEVYRARDTRLGRDVAVKILPEELASDPDRRKRFEREARAVAALDHPSLLALHDIGEADGLAFMVTELLEGETLHERMARGSVACERATEWGAAAAEALAAAHQRGIVHRDLKPENLFLTRDDRIKILDFGLAKAEPAAAGGEQDATLSAATGAGLVLGTVGYMSPEQARGEPVDGRSDIFSLGCVLYEAVTARRAFGGSTAQERIAAVLRDDPTDVSSLRPDAPRALVRVLQRCLAKDPHARFHSAGDLAFALRSIAEGSAPLAATVPTRPLRGGLLAVGLALAGLAVGYALRPAAHAPEPLVFALTPGLTREASPVISPDGKFVAYLASQGDRTDVWVKFVGGGPAANLTAGSDLLIQSNATIGGLDISPDGTAIAVRAGKPETPYWQRGVWLIPAPLGGPLRKVVDNAGGLRWSPDGSRILYMRPDPASGDAIMIARSDGMQEKVVVPASGIHLHQPAWSHDGNWVYFIRGPMPNNLAPTEIWRVPSGGGNPEPVVRTAGIAQDPLPTPDGHSLIYAGDQSGGALNLWWRPLRGGRERRLTSGAGEYLSPRVSRDGRRLVCEARTSVGSLRALDLPTHDGAGLGRALTGPGSEDSQPSSARTGRLAFSSARNGTRDIWISDADGGNPRPLTSDPESDSLPTISPDGSQVAFVSDRGGRRGLWLVPAEGGAPRPLVSADIMDRASWSPGAQSLVYAAAGSDERPGLWVVSASGGAPEPIAGVSGRAPAWSPSLDLIAYYTSAPGGRLLIRFTSSHGEPRLEDLDVVTTTVNAAAFSWNQRWLAVGTSPGSGDAEIVIVDLGSGGMRRMARLPPATGVHGIAWSADDRRLIYGLVEHESRLLLFDGIAAR